MNVNLFLIAIKAPTPPDNDFLVLSSTQDIMTIPSFELHENFPDIPLILEALLKKYIGFNTEYVPDFVIHDAIFNDNILNLYYYTFLDYRTELQYGNFQNINRLSNANIYFKLFKKLSII